MKLSEATSELDALTSEFHSLALQTRIVLSERDLVLAERLHIGLNDFNKAHIIGLTEVQISIYEQQLEIKLKIQSIEPEGRTWVLPEEIAFIEQMITVEKKFLEVELSRTQEAIEASREANHQAKVRLQALNIALAERKKRI